MKVTLSKIDKQAKDIAKKLNINVDSASLLINQSLSEDIIEVLTNDEWHELLSYNTIKNIPESAKVIAKYLKNDNAIIYIFGDYDNDGIQSTFIAYDCFKALIEALESKCEVEYYIPEREEGYGLSAEWCFDIVNNKDNEDKDILVITVDNGITKKYEVDYLKMNNVEVIVTDHHCPQEGLIPDCLVVDEFLDDNNEYMGVCGAGVVFKLCSYLLVNVFKDNTDYNLFYLPNVMTATISDMVPVTLENSLFVRNGLNMLHDYNCEYSDSFRHYIDFRGKNKKLTPKDIAFEYGPQINACGRMGNANLAFEYLLEENDLTDTYNEIVLLNDQRKKLTKQLTKVAIEDIGDTNDLFVYAITDKAGGCSGLLANKLVEHYNKPAIVFSETKNTYIGSARSIQGIELQKIFKILKDNDTIISYGGHEAACGIEVSKNKFNQFKDSFNNILLSIINSIKENPVQDISVYVDKQITVSELTNSKYLYNEIMFYNDINKPLFYFENVKIKSVWESNNNPNNIQFYFEDNTGTSNAWCWGFGETYKNMGKPNKVNLIFELEDFNGKNVIDIKYIEAA